MTLRKAILKLASTVLVFAGLVFGRSTQIRQTPSIPERIAAVQKSVAEMPIEIRKPFLFRAQWGNWGNWNNWNNWRNWANWNNWNNWGNWRNY
jgi:hypothetical protein